MAGASGVAEVSGEIPKEASGEVSVVVVEDTTEVATSVVVAGEVMTAVVVEVLTGASATEVAACLIVEVEDTVAAVVVVAVMKWVATEEAEVAAAHTKEVLVATEVVEDMTDPSEAGDPLKVATVDVGLLGDSPAMMVVLGEATRREGTVHIVIKLFSQGFTITLIIVISCFQ